MSVRPPRRTLNVPPGFRPVDLFVVMATPPSPVGESVVTSEPPPPLPPPGDPGYEDRGGTGQLPEEWTRCAPSNSAAPGGGTLRKWRRCVLKLPGADVPLFLLLEPGRPETLLLLM